MQPHSGLSAQQHADIQNLYACYNLCSDAGDAPGFAGCFTAAGELRLEPLGLRVAGRAALEAFKRQDAAGRNGRYRRHWNGSLHLERLGADTAAAAITVRGRCYFHGYNGLPGELPAFADAGVYDDTIVQEGGAWRFALRLLTLDATTFVPPQGDA